MLEKDYQKRFSRWLMHEFDGTGVFELKKGYDSIPFAALAEHQEHALLQAKHDRAVFKIPDAGFQNPFDCFRVEKVFAYVVLFFDYTEVIVSKKEKEINKTEKNNRGRKEFFLVDIDVWISERETSSRKSITMMRAREIGLPRIFKMESR